MTGGIPDGIGVLPATVVADPPWPLKAGGGHTRGYPRPGLLPYETMEVEDIALLNVPAADDAHLYLWTVNRYVEDAYDVARAWGFSPSTLIVWCKRPKGLGLGGTYSLSAEYVLFARRGSLAAKKRVPSTWHCWPRGAHSAKPEAFYDLVESVSPGPYLELFARRQRLGWDTWGNEALEHVELGAA